MHVLHALPCWLPLIIASIFNELKCNSSTFAPRCRCSPLPHAQHSTLSFTSHSSHTSTHTPPSGQSIGMQPPLVALIVDNITLGRGAPAIDHDGLTPTAMVGSSMRT